MNGLRPLGALTSSLGSTDWKIPIWRHFTILWPQNANRVTRSLRHQRLHVHRFILWEQRPCPMLAAAI
jgi:hypothetical protein